MRDPGARPPGLRPRGPEGRPGGCGTGALAGPTGEPPVPSSAVVFPALWCSRISEAQGRAAPPRPSRSTTRGRGRRSPDRRTWLRMARAGLAEDDAPAHMPVRRVAASVNAAPATRYSLGRELRRMVFRHAPQFPPRRRVRESSRHKVSGPSSIQGTPEVAPMGEGAAGVGVVGVATAGGCGHAVASGSGQPCPTADREGRLAQRTSVSKESSGKRWSARRVPSAPC